MLQPTWILINYNNTNDIHKIIRLYHDKALFIVVDNSKNYLQVENEKIIKPSENLGYIGGFQLAINELCALPKRVILSNSDIQIKNPSRLFDPPIDENPRIIAPMIRNLDGRNQNPHLKLRPSKKFYKIRSFFSTSSYLWTLWTVASKIKLRKSKNSSEDKFKIYAGHGSFLIFENIDLTPLQKEDYNFLFGEEIHFAEMALSSNIPIEFNKSIEVKHFEHASTSSIKDRVKVEFFHQSYSEILKRYYP